MPPAKTGKKLTKAEIDMLTRWVKEGGRSTPSTGPTCRRSGPSCRPSKNATWVKTPIDRFVLARLEKEGLSPMPEADRYALARRLALDLTGLPPTLAEAEAFAKDTSPDAYEKYVDRCCGSRRTANTGPGCGSTWPATPTRPAMPTTRRGPIWAFRDYVIKSFNANKPFDQFTIEQIAGDLLPNPTEEQIIATAFHRNTMTNNEGGTNDEEFRNVAVVDRVNTTLTTWMGTSIACAQCHDHKYDPITQKEYFGLFAILNNTADADRSDEAPVHSFYTDAQKKQRAAWEAEVAAIEKKFKDAGPKVLAAQQAWEKGLALNPVGERRSRKRPGPRRMPISMRDGGTVFVEKPGRRTRTRSKCR